MIQQLALQSFHGFGERIMSCWLELCYKVFWWRINSLKSWLIPNKDTCQQNSLCCYMFSVQKSSFAARSFFLSTAEALCLWCQEAEELLMLVQVLSPGRDMASLDPVTKPVAVWTVVVVSWHSMPHCCLSDYSHPFPFVLSVRVLFLRLIFFSFSTFLFENLSCTQSAG